MAPDANIGATHPHGENSTRPAGAVALSSLAPNKANFLRFWPDNEGRAEKQSQTKPIRRGRARGRGNRGCRAGFNRNGAICSRKASNSAHILTGRAHYIMV